MVAIKTYEANEYLNELSAYISELFVKWLGITGVAEQDTSLILETIHNNREVNYRVTYFRYSKAPLDLYCTI
jgi:hypothetical protein